MQDVGCFTVGLVVALGLAIVAVIETNFLTATAVFFAVLFVTGGVVQEMDKR
jgi:hypothetical protein